MPTLLNLILKILVRNWFAMTVEYQLVSFKGLGLAVRRCFGLFYSDNVVVGSKDLDWLKGALNVASNLQR